MEILFDLNAETILVSVAAMGYSTVRGIANVPAVESEESAPALLNRAKQELLKSKCATLDFDGNFSFSDSYQSAIKICATLNPVLVLRSRKGKSLPTITTFFKNGEYIYGLKLHEQMRYVMSVGTLAEMTDSIIKDEELPSVNAVGRTLIMDSECLHYKNLSDFEKAVTFEETRYDEITARTLVNCLNSNGRRVSFITEKNDWKENREWFFDENAILEKTMKYYADAQTDKWLELVRFVSISEQQCKEQLTALLMGDVRYD